MHYPPAFCICLVCSSVGWMVSLIGGQISCLLVLCQAFPTMLGHSQALQIIYIWQPYHYALASLYTHTTYCSLLQLLYVFSTVTLFLVAQNASIVDFGNNILNGSRLPSASESILYVMHALLWLVLDSNMVKITDFMLSKVRYCILTKSTLLSWWSFFISCGSSSCLISWTALHISVVCGPPPTSM